MIPTEYILQNKERVNRIDINDLDFLSVYEFPFRTDYDIIPEWIFDKNGHFIFQFNTNLDLDTRVIDTLVSVINGDCACEKIKGHYYYKEGCIFLEGNDKQELITIRGYGILTGIGCYCMSEDKARKIQDTLGNYIVDILNNYNKKWQKE